MFALYSLGGFLEALLGGAALPGGVLRVGGRRRHRHRGRGRAARGHGRAAFVQRGRFRAIWGLMGATLALVLGRRRVLPRLIARGLRQRLLLVLVINVALSFVPGIDLYAHFGAAWSASC